MVAIAAEPRHSTLGDDWIMTGFATWFIVGLMVDAWAHSNLDKLETFFTPWHALFYSGFAAVAGWTAWLIIRNLRTGIPLGEAIPDGYRATALAVPGFGLFGLGDMTWHIVFGIERELNILFSPTHLGLITTGFIIVTSPLRAAWNRDSGSLRPAILALGLGTTMVLLFLQYGNALGFYGQYVVEVMSDEKDGSASWLAARIVITLAIILLPLLLVARRWGIPLGGATLFGIPLIAMTAAQTAGRNYWMLAAALVGFIVMDIVAAIVQPTGDDRTAFWIFGGISALGFWTVYIAAAIAEAGRVPGIVELWTGTPIVAGLLGVALAALMLPNRNDSSG